MKKNILSIFLLLILFLCLVLALTSCTKSAQLTIGENGNWFLDGKDTGLPATGEAGKDGEQITIGANGNWFLDGKDTGISATVKDTPATPAVPETAFAPVLRFAVASDVHFVLNPDYRDTRLEKMYAQAYAYASEQTYTGLDGVFFAGDVTDTGNPIMLERFFTALETHTEGNTVSLACMGNHEFFYNSSTAVADFLAASGYENVDQHIKLGDYHFILISPSAGGNTFGQEKQAWLAQELANAAAEDPTGSRPIFVFQHQHVKDTAYGSAEIWGIDDLRAVLDNYPQVVDFSGHSHFPINDPRSIWQGDFTALNTASLKAHEMDLVGVKDALIFATDAEGGWSESSAGRTDGGQYYIVEVGEKNDLRILAFDIDTDSMAMEPIYLASVGDPSTFTYTDARKWSEEKPYFAEDAAVIPELMLDRLVRFQFPQTVNDTYVQNYRCDLYLNGSKVDTVYRLGCGFLYPRPDTLTLTFTNLMPGTTYQATITPVTAFGRDGIPLTFSFTTEKAIDHADGKVFSALFAEGNKATDGVLGVELTATGTPTTVYNETLGRYVGVFDGQSAFEFHEMGLYYAVLEQSVSFEAYLKINQKPASDYVNPFSNQQLGGYGFEYKSDRRLCFFVNVGGSYHNAHVILEEPGEWIHIVGTYDGESVRLYLNGVLAMETTAPGIVSPPAVQYLSIGGDSESGQSGKFANCDIAIANVYNKALSAEEIAALYTELPQ